MPKFTNDNDDGTPKGECEHCGGTLRPVGHARKKGKAHRDWGNRTLHKKCWRQLRQAGELGLAHAIPAS